MDFEELYRRYVEQGERADPQEFAAHGIAELQRQGALTSERCLQATIAATRLRQVLEQWKRLPDEQKPTLILALMTPEEANGLLCLYTVGLGTMLGLGDLTKGEEE